MVTGTDDFRFQNILLVDDHPFILDGIRDMLSGEEDIKVNSVFGTAEECLDYLGSKSGEIDLVISDVSLPSKSGIEMCQIIKQKFPLIKVLMLSMFNSAGVVNQALLAEADGYMLKSSSKVDFLKGVRRVLDNGAYYSEDIMPHIKARLSAVSKSENIELTKREQEVLSLIVQEFTSSEIAEKLFISKKTVDHHRQHLLEKTNSKSTIGLVKYALEQRPRTNDR
jgi:DNA-binding NarL/FixJ family response regulator